MSYRFLMPSLRPPEHLDRSTSRRARLITLIIAVCTAALVLSGCSDPFAGLTFGGHVSSSGKFTGPGPHSSAQDDEGDGVTIASLRPTAAALDGAYYHQSIAWKACHNDLECGTVTVPIDWQKVTSDSIRIALVMHPASSASMGDLLVNPGGPGGSGVGFVEDGVDDVVTTAVAERYNVIGFDPRGVGASQPVTCFDASGTDNYLYGILPGAVGSAAWIAAERQASRQLAAACEQHTGPVLAHIDSISVAEDMDVIRAALRQSRLNYVGYSYGTYLGTLYAGLFPSRVGKFVLDGADNPWGDSSDSGSDDSSNSDVAGVTPDVDGAVEQTVGFEDSLTTYLKSCLAHSDDATGGEKCPFKTSLASAKSQVEALFARVDAHPLVAKDGRKLGGATLSTAIDESLYDSTDWPDLTQMFVQLESGDTTQAFHFADDYNDRNYDGTYYDNGDFANLAISCLEDGHDVDLKFDAREATELRKVAPMLGIYAAYGDLYCSGWKYGPSPFPNPIHAKGSGPILILGTTGDPATPYQDAQSLADQLDNGHLVTLHGQGHTAYDLGDDCIDTTVDKYLLLADVPTHDPECH
jgi:pimeloyl-ACP methyl ester carboxylesterase